MVRINKELLAIMDDYNLFMKNDKQIHMPINITEEKPNHSSSLYIERPIKPKNPIGTNSFDCEIRNKDIKNYSFQLLTDQISDRVLFRLDEGNGTHRNNNPNIPLKDQSITTPHFHKYNKDGCFLAYKSTNLVHLQDKPLDIKEGFNLFCEEAKIYSENAIQQSDIHVQQNGIMPSSVLDDKDPLNGVNF